MKKTLCLSLLYLLCFSVYATDVLRMSTTTSTENSGLLAVLNPVFEKNYNVRIDVIAVGTGKALRLGENGDVDIVFVHAPVAEMAFIQKGFGTNRKAVMHNDFVLIGPIANPASISSKQSVQEALNLIATTPALFISRGDDSGTHKKELNLWQQAKITPTGSWYIEAGQGMGAVIKIADEKQAYTLTDRGTYLAFKEKTGLLILNQGDKLLFNPYHIIAVNPVRHTHVNFAFAKKYIDFITGKKAQAMIQAYKKNGKQLFYPDAQ